MNIVAVTPSQILEHLSLGYVKNSIKHPPEEEKQYHAYIMKIHQK